MNKFSGLGFLVLFAFGLSQCKLKPPKRTLKSEFEKAFLSEEEAELWEVVEDKKAIFLNVVKTIIYKLGLAGNEVYTPRVATDPHVRWNQIGEDDKKDITRSWEGGYIGNVKKEKSELLAYSFKGNTDFFPIAVTKTEILGTLGYIFYSNRIITTSTGTRDGNHIAEYVMTYHGKPKSREISKPTQHMTFRVLYREGSERSWKVFKYFDGINSAHAKKEQTEEDFAVIKVMESIYPTFENREEEKKPELNVTYKEKGAFVDAYQVRRNSVLDRMKYSKALEDLAPDRKHWVILDKFNNKLH